MLHKLIHTFDDWKDLFQTWQKGIGYNARLFASVLNGYQFADKFAPVESGEIEFGEFAGARKWRDTTAVPREEIRDLLLRLIAVQGDTVFASVEQQRSLLDSAPSERDLFSMVRINAEEMRHGWQTSYLAIYWSAISATKAKLKPESCWNVERTGTNGCWAPSTNQWRIGRTFSPIRLSSIGTACTSSRC